MNKLNFFKSFKSKGGKMAKPTYTERAKSVVPEPFNSILPGPKYKSDTTYSDGSVRTGYGKSKSEAERNSRNTSSSYYKSKK
jgi:hypothetical protein